MDQLSVPGDLQGEDEAPVHMGNLRSVANDAKPLFLLVDSAAGSVALEPGVDQSAVARVRKAHSDTAGQRAFDLVVAIGMLIFLLPLMIACAVAVRCSSRGPLLFSHTRFGREGDTFRCLKFRTMTVAAEVNLEQVLRSCAISNDQWCALHKLRQDPRTTRVGRFLRRYSLDELPQLINVVKGEMSIVGPRPIVAAEIARYGANFEDYCSVKPGLTGLWQVSGRHSLTYEQRVALDAQYAANKSLRGDIVILLRTVPVVLFGENE